MARWFYGLLMLGAVLQAAPSTAQTNELAGYLDAVTPAYANGWACMPGTDTPVSVAFYAGAHLIGIYPTGELRPDTAGPCGREAPVAGFHIDMTPVVIQQFLNQSDLRFLAVAGQAALVLPPSTARSADPYPLPGGLLTNLSAQGAISGVIYPSVASSANPMIDILTGGPLNSGGAEVASVAPRGASGTGSALAFAADLPSALFAGRPGDYAVSLYAVAASPGAPSVQLGSPFIPGARYVAGSARVAQSGSVSGITNAIFTRWVDGQFAFAGLSGSVSLSGTYPSFSEALVTYGFTSDSQSSCAQRNGTTPAQLPPFTRLAAVILKSTTIGGDTLPVSLTLPYGVGLGQRSGVCLVTWISAGYAYLVPYAAKYTTVNARLAVALLPRAKQMPVVIPQGLGNEFLFPAGSTSEGYTLVALRANMPLVLDAVSGSVSAGGILGAPAGSAQSPPPSAGWTADTKFAFMTAQICANLGLQFGAGNPYFSVAMDKAPAPYALPDSNAILVDVPLHGLAASVTQQSFYQGFPPSGASGAESVALSTGDCIVAFHSATGNAGALDGALDLENQSTLYLRVP